MTIKAKGQISVVDITDAYSVTLTSETYTFVGNTTGAPAGLSCSTEVVAYNGTTLCSSVTITAANIKCPTGISATVTNNGTSSPTVTFKTTATITTACEATIPVTITGTGVTINKKFSFAVAKTGATGATGAAGKDGQMLYAVCSTAAGTAAKVATLASGTITLKAGVSVSVKFTYANNVSSPTLNVNGTGAKSIRVNGAAITSAAYYWVAGAVITLVYDGTYWNVSDAGSLYKASEASKTATNFIEFDESNGLLVGDKTDGTWNGYRTQITSSAFNILDAAGTMLASYGEKLVELGKNATDAVIKLCGGKGIIRFVTEDYYDYLELTSKNIRLRADNLASLYHYFYDGNYHATKSLVNASETGIEMYARTSSNIDPETQIGTWDQSYFYIEPLSIYGESKGEVRFTARDNIRLSSEFGNVNINSGDDDNDGVFINGKNIIDLIHPVGSQIYNSKKDFDPNKYYPGTTWVRIKGYVLAGINEGDGLPSHLTFDKASGSKIGATHQDLRAWIGAYDANVNNLGYRAEGKVSGENFTYGFNHGAAIASIGFDRINHTTMVSNTSGQTQVSVIQPTQLTYIWERTA